MSRSAVVGLFCGGAHRTVATIRVSTSSSPSAAWTLVGLRARPTRCSDANSQSPERSPVKTRPVRLAPWAAGASPTTRTAGGGRPPARDRPAPVGLIGERRPLGHRAGRWREEVAAVKRASRRRALLGPAGPGFGDPDARVLVVGLAPAAHGANRTGRVFTGDRSGDWLFAALHRAGLATQPTSSHAGDGLALVGARVVAAVRCAPPANRRRRRARHLRAVARAELRAAAPTGRSVVALGGFAWDAALRSVRGPAGGAPTEPRFGHGADARSPAAGAHLLGCYHPSQQNTFTGRLTVPMLAEVLGRAAALGCRSRRTPVAQPVEEVALKALQSGFESRRGPAWVSRWQDPGSWTSRTRRTSSARSSGTSGTPRTTRLVGPTQPTPGRARHRAAAGPGARRRVR